MVAFTDFTGGSQPPLTPAAAPQPGSPATHTNEGAKPPQQAAAQAAPVTPPPADPALWQNIPQALRDRPQWCVAAPDKAPKQVDGRDARTNDPSTWNTFENVVNFVSQYVQAGYGIGYVVSESDPFAFTDLDVKTPETHPDKPAKWATPEQIARYEKILAAFPNTYAERSRSGLGYHIIVEGTTPNGKGINRNGVEIYPATHFMITTGNVLEGRPLEITNHQEMLTTLANEICKASDRKQADLVEIPPVLSDQQVLDKATAASNGQKFLALWHCSDHTALTVTTDSGDPYDSMSAVDDALLNFLAHYTQSNEQAHRLFLLSEPGKREKVQQRGRKYTDRSFKHIRSEQQEKTANAKFFKETSGGAFNFTQEVPGKAAGWTLLTDDDLVSLPRLVWIVKNLVPARGFGTFYGSTMTYKSFLMLDMLFHIANGLPWFGHRVKKTCAVYTPFEGKGGVPKRVKALRAKAKKLGLTNTGIKFLLEAKNLRDPNDRANLIALLKAEAPHGIVCIDTLAQAGPGIDENGSEGMGEMIAIFQEIAEATGWVVVAIHHAGKNAAARQRGHTSLEGALDFSVACYRTEEEVDANGVEKKAARTYFENWKVKDAASGSEFPFDVEIVELGEDEDGDMETSLTIVDPKVTTPAREETELEKHARETAAQAKATSELAKIEEQRKVKKRADNAVWNYISDLNQKGMLPSQNYVWKNILTDCPTVKLKQPEFRDAFDRLEVEKRITNEGTYHKPGWRAIDNGYDHTAT